MPPLHDGSASASAIYAYAGNDPINRSDPNGHHWLESGKQKSWEDKNGTWHNHDGSRSQMEQRATYRDGVAFYRARDTEPNWGSFKAQMMGQGGSAFYRGYLAAGLKQLGDDLISPWTYGEAATNLPVVKGPKTALGIFKSAKEAAEAEAKMLRKKLSSDEGVAEILAGKGEIIAGVGTKVPLRDAQRLASQYGGKAEDWAKISSTAPGRLQTHAYKNVVTGQIVEFKSKLP
jgi:hypothetical protein